LPCLLPLPARTPAFLPPFFLPFFFPNPSTVSRRSQALYPLSYD
jgi:hypothetical protein